MNRSNAVTLALLLAAGAPEAHAQIYRSASLDGTGQLSVTQSSGAVFKAPLLRDQVSFGMPALSKDHRTIAWLANYADPSAPGSADPIAGRLVLFKAGRVLRTYGTDQVIWSWQFVQDGKDVAFCTGPLHGGADTCKLHSVGSGHRLATWNARASGDPPPWVKGLSY